MPMLARIWSSMNSDTLAGGSYLAVSTKQPSLQLNIYISYDPATQFLGAHMKQKNGQERSALFILAKHKAKKKKTRNTPNV